MKKLATNTVLCMQPVPQTIVSCRDKDGRNNALVVGFTANVSLDPVMVMVGIVPSRFSHHMVKESGCFVINLPKKSFKKEYDYLGSKSGRDEDKVKASGLTPIAVENTVAYKEAELTFVCKKLYQHQFSRDDLAPEVQQYYASSPAIYPDFNGGWQPHIMFIGGITSVIDHRSPSK